MSVRVSDRNTSKCEYVYNAFQLSNLVNERMTKYCNKIANDKRYKHFTKSSYYGIWKSPILFANKVYYYCQCANKMRDTNKRLTYLSKASENLTLLKSSVQQFYDLFKSIVKDKFIMLLAEKIETQTKLLGGQYNYVRNIGCGLPLPS